MSKDICRILPVPPFEKGGRRGDLRKPFKKLNSYENPVFFMYNNRYSILFSELLLKEGVDVTHFARGSKPTESGSMDIQNERGRKCPSSEFNRSSLPALQPFPEGRRLFAPFLHRRGKRKEVGHVSRAGRFMHLWRGPWIFLPFHLPLEGSALPR